MGHLHPSLWALLPGPIHLPFTYPRGRGAAALGPDPDNCYFCKLHFAGAGPCRWRVSPTAAFPRPASLLERVGADPA